jgi:hypothetical protein
MLKVEEKLARNAILRNFCRGRGAKRKGRGQNHTSKVEETREEKVEKSKENVVVCRGRGRGQGHFRGRGGAGYDRCRSKYIVTCAQDETR